MFNTEGFDKLYAYIMKDYPQAGDDALLKEIFWIAFSDLTPGMRPTGAELERRLDRYSETGGEYTDGVKIMSAVCGVPLYKLVANEADAVCRINIADTTALAYPVYSSAERIDPEIAQQAEAVPTTIFHVANYLAQNTQIEGILLNPGTADFAIKTKDIEDFFMNFSSTFGFFEDCIREGISSEYLFPMIFAWFDDRDIEALFKDGTFCEGHVTELIYGDLGDVTALRVRTADGFTIAGMDEISTIKALPVKDLPDPKDVFGEDPLGDLKDDMFGPDEGGPGEPGDDEPDPFDSGFDPDGPDNMLN